MTRRALRTVGRLLLYVLIGVTARECGPVAYQHVAAVDYALRRYRAQWIEGDVA